MKRENWKKQRVKAGHLRVKKKSRLLILLDDFGEKLSATF